MNLILRQVVGYQQGRRSALTSADPELKKQLSESQKDLNSILNKWKFGDTPLKTSQEFLDKFAPWVEEKIKSGKELKVFLAKKGVKDLKEAEDKLANRDLSEGERSPLDFNKDKEELTQLKQELEEFLQLYSVNSLEHLKETWTNTEQDYLEQIRKLKESQTSEDYEELIAELDETRRAQGELEQEVLALNNQLKLKQQEVGNKEKTLETLKKEKDKNEVNLNKKITEKNGIITTLTKEVNQLKAQIQELKK